MMIKQKGVTLIETLIVVAIIGVLSAIAYPAYQSYVLKGHRTQAMGDMVKIQLASEESYTQNSTYDFSIVSGSLCSICDTDSNRYTFKIEPKTSNYVIKAIAKNAQTGDTECLLNNEIHLNSTSKGTPASCW